MSLSRALRKRQAGEHWAPVADRSVELRRTVEETRAPDSTYARYLQTFMQMR